MLLVDLPPLEEKVLIEKVSKVPISQPWLEDPGKPIDLSGQKEVWGWRSTYWCSRNKKTKDTMTYCSWPWDVPIFHCSGWDDQHLLPYVFMSLQGFLGDLARSLGKDATLTDVLQILDEHNSMVMMFDTLSKELYSFKQTSGENVAEFGVHLSQQVQILQSKYLGRIQQEHVEERKWDHFYEGLNSQV